MTVETVKPARRGLRARQLMTAVSGNVFYAVAQAGTLAIITRSQGGAVDAVDFFLAQAIATPIAVLVSGRVRDQFATEPIPSPFLERITRVLLLSLFAGVLGSLVWFVASDGQRRWVGIWILVSNLAQVLVTAYQGRVIASSKFGRSSAISSCLGALSVASIGTGYAFGGLSLGTFFLAATWLALGGALVIIETIHDRGRSDVAVGATSTLRDDMLIGLAATASIGQSSLARVGTEISAGAQALAQFGTVSQLARLGSLIMSGARVAISPQLAEAQRTGTIGSFIAKLLRRGRIGIAAMTTIGFMGGWLLGPWLIELIFSASVSPSRATAALVLGAAPLLYGSMLLTQVAIAINDSTSLLRINIASLLTTSVLILPLGSAFGATGAALSLAAGHLVHYSWLDLVMSRHEER